MFFVNIFGTFALIIDKSSMKYIGNIITDNKIDDVALYNVIKNKEDIIHDIPTLIIGYKKVKTLYDSFSMLDWKIEDNVYWTYGRRERGEKYYDDLDRFKKLCFNNMIKTVDYRLFNVLTENVEHKKLFFSFLKDSSVKTVYIENDMAYIYNGNKHVIGFSLRDVEYGGGNKKKTLSVLLNNNVVSSKDVFTNEFAYSLKNIPYIIPYLYS